MGFLWLIYPFFFVLLWVAPLLAAVKTAYFSFSKKLWKAFKNPLVKEITPDKLIFMGCLKPSSCICLSWFFLPLSRQYLPWRWKKRGENSTSCWIRVWGAGRGISCIANCLQAAGCVYRSNREVNTHWADGKESIGGPSHAKYPWLRRGYPESSGFSPFHWGIEGWIVLIKRTFLSVTDCSQDNWSTARHPALSRHLGELEAVSGSSHIRRKFLSKNKCKVGLFPPTGRGNRKTCFWEDRLFSNALDSQAGGGAAGLHRLSWGGSLKAMSLRPFGWLGQVRFLCLTSTGTCPVLTFCGRLGQPQGVTAVQLLKPCLLASPWTTARQASLSSTISWALLKVMSIESVMPSNHLILCRPLLLPPSLFPSIRVFSNELALRIRWPKHCSASASILPMDIQGWCPLGLTGLISLLSKGLSRVFSSTTVQKH